MNRDSTRLVITQCLRAFTAPLDARAVYESLGLFVLFVLCALPVALNSTLFTLERIDLSVQAVLLLILIAFFSPSLLEETVFRVLLFPAEKAQMPARNRYGLMAFSLGLYVVSHPLNAWLFWPWARDIFYRPSFLLMVSLLGLTCTLARLRTGSLWPGVVIHWLTVVSWKLFFAGPDFNFS